MAKRLLLEITPPTDLDDAFLGNLPALLGKRSLPLNCQSASDSILPGDLPTIPLFDVVEPSLGLGTCYGSPNAHKWIDRTGLLPDEGGSLPLWFPMCTV